jgi:hypothetical protein
VPILRERSANRPRSERYPAVCIGRLTAIAVSAARRRRAPRGHFVSVRVYSERVIVSIRLGPLALGVFAGVHDAASEVSNATRRTDTFGPFGLPTSRPQASLRDGGRCQITGKRLSVQITSPETISTLSLTAFPNNSKSPALVVTTVAPCLTAVSAIRASF